MNEIMKKEINVEDKIHEIRKIHVIVDRDLAKIYGVETKQLMQQVRRNIERFPERYMFQMTDEEFREWKSHFVTSNSDKMGLRRPPYCFTEQGVAMLATVLRTDIVEETSIMIMRSLVKMRKYFSNFIDSNILVNHENRLLIIEDDMLDQT